MRIFLLLASFISFSALSSDVQIITDTSKGQGFFYQHQDKCFVVTPSHVIEGANEISAITANRKSYDAKLIKDFDIDLALLELPKAHKVCKTATFNQSKKLTSLLKIYEEGVLKSKLADGSTLQTKVNIVGVDETEYLEVKPQKNKDILKQGYSGSVLFIANQPSGILLEVDEGSGYVYRSDALNKMLDKHFYPNGKPVINENIIPMIGDDFKGPLSKGQKAEYKFQGEANSAVEFEMIPTKGEVGYDFFILDSRGRKLFKDGTFYSQKEYRFTFTPPKSGTYTVQLNGTRGNSTYHIKMNQWSLDADLRGEGNIIEVGDEISNAFAKGSIAEYKFQGEANSAVEFEMIPTKGEVRYDFFILDSRGKKLFKDGTFYSHKEYRFTYTPPKNGTYTVQLKGTRGHSTYHIKMSQWSLDADLRGEGNIIEVGDEISNTFAKGSIAEYKFQGEANSAVEFEMIPTEGEVRYDFLVLDSRGRKLFKDGTFYSHKEYRFTFTPPKSGTYTVQLKGTRGHSTYHIKMNQWSLNADLRGEGNVIEVGDEISNAFAKGSIAEYKFQGEANSAVEFEMIPTIGEVGYDLYIYDKNGKKLFKDGTFYSHKEYRFTFTPPKNGTYTVQLKGTRGHSTYHIKMSQWSLDADLRGEGNVIEVDDEISNAFAKGSVAEYKFQGESNSAVEFEMIPTEGEVGYDFFIIDSRGKKLFKDGTFYSHKEYRFTFTPPKSGTYTVQLKGTRGHSTYQIKMSQWSLDADLRGEGNIIEVGDEISNAFAKGSIAEYKFQGEANSAVEFEMIPTIGEVGYDLYIYDKNGKKLFKDGTFYSYKEYRFTFTPPKSGLYTIQLKGTRGHSSYSILLRSGGGNEMIKLLLSFSILSLLSFSSYGETISILSKSINESYSKTVKVSGSFFLGMQINQKSALEKLNILFPDNSKGLLCIDIASIDGRYKANIKHSLAQTVSGLQQLDFPSQYQTEINNYKPIELAVRTTIGKDCSEVNSKSLIASWSSQFEDDNVVLLIRSDARKDVVYAPNVTKGFKCKKFKNEYKVTYDKYCELKGVDVTKITSLKIKRKNLQKMPDEIIKLAYK